MVFDFGKLSEKKITDGSDRCFLNRDSLRHARRCEKKIPKKKKKNLVWFCLVIRGPKNEYN
jgi:hypothetical protein